MSVAAELREQYVRELRRDGAVRDSAMADAFATVPRELFVADGFQRRDGTWVGAGDDDFLDTVYRNDVLVTKLHDGVPVSSSSQPSLMAMMLTALGVTPGMRVLEIGAGTGYNAALLAALGAQVTSVDVQPDVVRRAGDGLRRAGFGGVEVFCADGYLGHHDGAPYDRIIVTVGVAGVSPHWVAQLSPDGHLLAPVVHAGNHPVLCVRRDADGTVIADGVCAAGFMSAHGPLSADHPWAHPRPVRHGLAAPDVVLPPRWDPPLTVLTYHDLWFAAGAWHPRTTYAPLRGRAHGGCVLVDEDRAGGAAILTDGAVLASGPDAHRYAGDAVELIDRWVRAGQPAIPAWRCDLVPAGEPPAPIRVPRHWRLTG
ncbi:MAG TPA: methyltransferase domain-containing protein [Catenuloplanes sp.]